MSREANLHKLEMYKILYGAYADEIKNLWQRSIFLGAFMVLVWSGYGVLQLKAIEPKIVGNLAQSALCAQSTKQTLSLVYISASLGLCTVIIVLSWLWIAMAKGSKFVQEAHEEHIKNFDFQNDDIKNLFCDLDSYEYAKHIDSKNNTKDKTLNPKLNDRLFCCGVLQPYRYSPSKINITLGWVSCLLGGVLFIAHIMSIFCTTLCLVWCIVLVVLIIIALCNCLTLIKSHLKGGENPNLRGQKC